MSRTRIAKKEATSIKIDPELWKEVKIEAVRQDKTVSELVEEALESHIGQHQNLQALSPSPAKRVARLFRRSPK
ncbi:MAG: hypothetical protein V1857_03700 [archaeon]